MDESNIRHGGEALSADDISFGSLHRHSDATEDTTYLISPASLTLGVHFANIGWI